MRQSRKFSFTLLGILTARVLSNANGAHKFVENEDVKSNQFSLSKRWVKQSIGAVTRKQFTSLPDKAFQITGDTPFSKMLEEEEMKIEQRRIALQQRSEASSSFQYGFFVPVFLSLATDGYTTFFQDGIKKSVNILTVAWLPVLFFSATWIEILSIAVLLLQPSIWTFLVNDLVMDVWTILKKLLLSELWRHFWRHATKFVPMPILSPPAEYLELTPNWFQLGWHHATKVVDKFVQGLFRKSVERWIQESLGITVKSISESYLERRNYWSLEPPVETEEHDAAQVGFLDIEDRKST